MKPKPLYIIELFKSHMKQIKINYKNEILLALLKKESHGRELAKQLNTSLTRIQSNLNQLRNINILDYKTQGKNHVYFIKRNLTSKLYILNAENYKLAKLLIKNSELEPIFQDLIKTKTSLIILFGSYAKGTNKKDSDIDIYIDTTDQKVKNEAQFHHKLSIKIGKFNKEDLLIKEIIKNHIIIKGAEEFYEKIKFFD